MSLLNMTGSQSKRLPLYVTAGYPHDLTTGLLDAATLGSGTSGTMNSSSNGQIFENLYHNGDLYINHPNVIIRNCRIFGGAYYGIQITANATGLTVHDCEIGPAGGTPIKLTGIGGATVAYTALRLNIHHMEDGLKASGGLIQDCYIHDLGGNASWHADGIQISSSATSTVINHNTIINGTVGATAAVFAKADNAPIGNVSVINNYVDGGAYTTYFDGSGQYGNMSSVALSGNRYGRAGLYKAIYSNIGNAFSASDNLFLDTFNNASASIS